MERIRTPQLPTDASLLHTPIGTSGIAAADAFRKVYERHVEAVLRFLRLLTPADDEDLTAETFVIAWQKRMTFDSAMDSARPWLLGIARNVARSHRRRSPRYDTTPIDESHEPIAELEAWTYDSRVVREVLKGESEQVVHLLFLVAIADLTIRDASSVLGMTPGAARVAMHRIRAKSLSSSKAD